jgi:hypothetical protein
MKPALHAVSINHWNRHNRTMVPQWSPARSAVTLAGLVAAALLAVGCASAGGEQVVFADPGGSNAGLRGASTVDIVDVGLDGLHNITGHTVQVRKVSLVSVPKAVHLDSVTAYVNMPVGVVSGT